MDKTQTYTLVIWEEVPENIQLWLIPDKAINDEDRKVLDEAQITYINSDENIEATKLLSDAFASEKDNCQDPGSIWACRWKQYFYGDRAKAAPIKDVKVSHVYLTGWFM